MAQSRAPKIVAFRVVFAFVGTLLIIHSLPMYAQAPSFQRAVAYGSGGDAPISATLGDLNGDGILDIVVANQCVTSDSCPSGGGNVCTSADFCSHGAVGVLLGNGDGTFRPAVTYETSGYLSFSVALGDLNGDGKLDLVVVNDCGVVPIDSEGNCPYATVDVMFGNGDGTFGPPVSHQLDGWQPVSVALRDLNGDGKSDIVVADICNIPNTCSGTGCTCTTGLVEVLLNESNGIFSGPIGYDSGAPFGRSVALGDVNRDGKLDVLVGNDGGVGVLLGNGDGTFKPAVMYGAGGQWIAVGDVNSDGKPDLLSVASQSIGIVDVLLGNGDGTFKPAITYPTGGEFANSVAVADVNGDGKPDLVVTNLSGIWPDQRAVGVLTGNGDGTFQPAVTFDSGGGSPFSVAAGDLNKDGRPDVVVLNTTGLGLGVLLNNTPFCTTAPTITLSTTPASLWPPNGKMVPVKISGTVTDTGSGCSIKAAAYTVKDEYSEVQPTGPVRFGVGGTYSFTVWLQASRLGTDLDGRRYTVTVSVSNNAGKTGSQAATVIVPHERGSMKPASE